MFYRKVVINFVKNPSLPIKHMLQKKSFGFEWDSYGPKTVGHKEILSKKELEVEFDALCQGQVASVIDGIGLPAHISFPCVGS